MGALDDGVRLRMPDAEAWRAWLAENHAVSKGAWLLRPRPGSAEVLVDYDSAIEHALCFGWVDGPVRTFDEATSGLWFAPRRPRARGPRRTEPGSSAWRRRASSRTRAASPWRRRGRTACGAS